MTLAIHLAGEADLPRVESLVGRFHAEYGLETSEEHRRAALAPLCAGSPHGAIYLAGPRNAPMGYVIISFGWAIELGGLDGFVDELWVRPSVRGRGVGSALLGQVSARLAREGLKALHLEVDETDGRTQDYYHRLGYRLRDRYRLMSITF